MRSKTRVISLVALLAVSVMTGCVGPAVRHDYRQDKRYDRRDDRYDRRDDRYGY